MVQKILRHASVTVTRGHYIKTSSDDKRKAMAEFSDQWEKLASENQLRDTYRTLNDDFGGSSSAPKIVN